MFMKRNLWYSSYIEEWDGKISDVDVMLSADGDATIRYYDVCDSIENDDFGVKYVKEVYGTEHTVSKGYLFELLKAYYGEFIYIKPSIRSTGRTVRYSNS